jgi:hypothetical protein
MARIKLNFGNMELECEGAEEFLKTETPNILKMAVETHRQIPATTGTAAEDFKIPLTEANKVIEVLNDFARKTLTNEEYAPTLAEILAACEKAGVEKNNIFPILSIFTQQGDILHRLKEYEVNFLINYENNSHFRYDELVATVNEASRTRTRL